MMEEQQSAVSGKCRVTRKCFKEMLHLNMKTKVKQKRCLILYNVHHVARIPKLGTA